MNRATARRPISGGDTGGFPGQFPPASPAQPEASATVAPPSTPTGLESPSLGSLTELGEDQGTVFDVGKLPGFPLPAPPPGSNLPIALPGYQSGGGGRSMMGPPPAGQDLFGGGGGGEVGDEDLMRRILPGLPQGR